MVLAVSNRIACMQVWGGPLSLVVWLLGTRARGSLQCSVPCPCSCMRVRSWSRRMAATLARLWQGEGSSAAAAGLSHGCVVGVFLGNVLEGRREEEMGLGRKEHCAGVWRSEESEAGNGGGGGGDTVAGKCLLRLGLELTSCFRRMVLMMTASRTPVAILRISSCQTKEHRELMMLVDHCVLGFCDVRLYEGRNTSSTKTGKP